MEKIRTQIPAASSPNRCRIKGQRKNPTTTLAPSANQLELTFFRICSFSSLRIRMGKRFGLTANEPQLVRLRSWSAFCGSSGRQKQSLGFNRFRSGWEDTEDDIHAVGLQIELPQAFLFDDIVERQMGGLFCHALPEDVPHPEDVLPQVGLAHAGKSHPEGGVIHR